MRLAYGGYTLDQTYTELPIAGFPVNTNVPVKRVMLTSKENHVFSHLVKGYPVLKFIELQRLFYVKLNISTILSKNKCELQFSNSAC